MIRMLKNFAQFAGLKDIFNLMIRESKSMFKI